MEIVTGVNLPMVIKTANLEGHDESLREVAQLVARKGAGSVIVAGTMLEPSGEGVS